MAEQTRSHGGLWPAIRLVERSVVAMGIVAIVSCILWGVATRYVLHTPSPWISEVAAIAFCWSSLFGGALLYDTNGHPRMYEPTAIASAALRRLTLAAGGLVEAAVLALLAWYSLKQTYINLHNPTSILRLSVGGVYYAPLAWFALSSLARLASGARQWI